MNKSELLRELRALTQAGMKDCADALDAAGDDIQKAVDIIKTKGQNIVAARIGNAATEGVVSIAGTGPVAMVEVNCQTDFVARHPDFVAFADMVANKMSENFFDVNANSAEITDVRDTLIAKYKENVVVRRWWVEEALDETCKVFSYVHNGSKIGVLVTLKAPSLEMAQSPDFVKLGEGIALQIAAMSPLAVSQDKIPQDELDRQTDIFRQQIVALNKPLAAHQKIFDGKMNKWFTEVCLLKQESVLVPKTTIEQLLHGVEIVGFHRCQVGA